MKFLQSCLSLFGLCAILASCTPYQPPYIPPGPVDPGLNPSLKKTETITSQKQKDIQKQRDELRKNKVTTIDPVGDREKKEALKKKEDLKKAGDTVKRDIVGGPRKKPKKTIPVATPVPGKEGFVFSPFNNKVINVRGFPSGTAVKDPEDPSSRPFRVP